MSNISRYYSRGFSLLMFAVQSLFILLVINTAYGQNNVADAGSFIELSYDATYAGGKIAEIDFIESYPYQYQGMRVRRIECRIESSGLFNINGTYQSVIADDYSLAYLRSDEGQPGNKRIIEYRFDYRNGKAKVTQFSIDGADSTETSSELKNIDKKYFDTLSMILRLRDSFDTLTVPAYIPVFVDQGQDSILIDSIKNMIIRGTSAALIQGKLPYVPFPGFGNRIELFISKDEKRAPLGGRIQMALGYIEINLRDK